MSGRFEFAVLRQPRGGRRSRAPRLAAAALTTCAAVLLLAAPATADLTSLKSSCQQRDALDGDIANGVKLPYLFCDDGVPDQGGRTPNPGAVKAVAVPQRYAGVRGLPAKVLPAEPNTGADSNGDIALDVDVSLPDPKLNPKPPGGYPLVVMMHGCCGGNKSSWESSTVDPNSAERWHYNNAWFAARGYVVLNYTARGFVSSDQTGNRGSTGESQLDDARYEINDYQQLAGLLADDRFFKVNPHRVVVTGGSYGGGFSWLALTDPKWRTPGGRQARLAAAAPKYGWSDLLYSLVPNGVAGLRDELPDPDGSDTRSPLGFPKQSIAAALYASGKTGVPPGTGSHTTFPPKVDQAMACLQTTDPFETNPVCSTTVNQLLPEFVEFRSSYYQNDFFQDLRHRDLQPVPVYSAGTFTDNLFPEQEHRRMVERLKDSVPGYPVQEYYGDYQHFTQNKAREWGDVCGSDRHVCEFSDYPHGNLNARPHDLARRGITMRLNRFIDHFARPPGNRHQPAPDFDVTASLQICPDNATDQFPADGPGPRFTAKTFDALAPHSLRIALSGTQATTNHATPNEHAVKSEPIANEQTNDAHCPVETTPAGPGVATYDSPVLPRRFTMIGQTRVSVTHTGAGSGIQLNGRLYDLFPDGKAVLVDRGPRVIGNEANGTTVLDLQGNGWRFPAGHRIRIELAQDNSPYIKASSQPSALALTEVELRLPVREKSQTLGPAPARSRRGDQPETAEGVSGDVAVPSLPEPPSLPLPLPLP